MVTPDVTIANAMIGSFQKAFLIGKFQHLFAERYGMNSVDGHEKDDADLKIKQLAQLLYDIYAETNFEQGDKILEDDSLTL